jgi:hypothetical protein
VRGEVAEKCVTQSTPPWSKTPSASKRSPCWPPWTLSAPASSGWARATAAAFTQHPDQRIITSFVGLADLTGARLLAEIGDDRTRFADARALKAFAGSAPVTKASGRSIRITHRHVKNNRLAAVGFVWAFIAAGCQGPTRAHYLARRDHGDRHPAALRHLYNRMLGQLYHCLQTNQTYDPIWAYGPPPTDPTRAAA